MKTSRVLRRLTAGALVLGVPALALIVLTQSGAPTQAGEAAMIQVASTDLLAAGPAQMPTESLSNWQYTGYWSWIWVWQWVRVNRIWQWLKIRKSHWCN